MQSYTASFAISSPSFAPGAAARAWVAGSRACFRVAAKYLAGFAAVPRALVVGNHDLEGSEFATDEANLAAWGQVCLRA